MSIQVSDPAIIVNNDVIAVEANSVEYTEGFGEQSVRAASTGGGGVEPVFSNDVGTNISMVKFSIPATVDNVALARSWKAGLNANVVQLAGSTAEGRITRTFTQAAIVNDYAVPLTADGVIELEFMSKAAI